MTQTIIKPYIKCLDIEIDAQGFFNQVLYHKEQAFWLDNPSNDQDQCGEWSYLGCPEGPHAKVLTYWQAKKQLQIQQGGQESTETVTTIFSYLKTQQHIKEVTGIPSPFKGGYIGYFGYELRGDNLPSSHYESEFPDAYLFYCDRFIAINHRTQKTYLICRDLSDQQQRALTWIEETLEQINLSSKPTRKANNKAEKTRLANNIEDKMRIKKDTYLDYIQQCQEWIKDGQAYQLCLCNQLSIPNIHQDLREVYATLRQNNPSPYSACFKTKELTILSLSPECFLRVSATGRVTTKPIKGTIARKVDPKEDEKQQKTLQNNPKERAENTMIVDLLRNDLAKVSQAGSVTVDAYLSIESYATVHQLVSTVSSQLAAGKDIYDLLKATFPGGSMTGAPKARAIALLEELEQGPRGPYSGCLGWMSDDGASHLSIVIRSIIANKNCLKIGVGGGITHQSIPEMEWEELKIKAQCLYQAITNKHHAL
ncbi:MAG: anthranilate synthase component I family protein [bacterium]